MLKDYNKDEFLSALQSVDFITLFSGLSYDPNLMTATFHEIFVWIDDKCTCPFETTKGTNGIYPLDKPLDKGTQVQARSNKNIGEKRCSIVA